MLRTFGKCIYDPDYMTNYCIEYNLKINCDETDEMYTTLELGCKGVSILVIKSFPSFENGLWMLSVSCLRYIPPMPPVRYNTGHL